VKITAVLNGAICVIDNTILELSKGEFIKSRQVLLLLLSVTGISSDSNPLLLVKYKHSKKQF